MLAVLAGDGGEKKVQGVNYSSLCAGIAANTACKWIYLKELQSTSPAHQISGATHLYLLALPWVGLRPCRQGAGLGPGGMKALDRASHGEDATASERSSAPVPSGSSSLSAHAPVKVLQKC